MSLYREALSWRIMRGDRAGDHFMYFDAAREVPAVRELTEDENLRRLDKLVSVSAVETDYFQTDLVDGCDGSEEEPPSSFDLWPEEK